MPTPESSLGIDAGPAAALVHSVAGHAARLRALLDAPARAQLGVLREIIEQNQDSAIGREHRFAAMLKLSREATAGAASAGVTSLPDTKPDAVPAGDGLDFERELYGYFNGHFLDTSDATLAPWIERIANGEPAVLTSAPVLAFEETGGSSGGRKRIPYTAQGLQAFQRGLLPWLDDLFEHYPALAGGRFYWAISPACRAPAITSGGIPVGLGSDAAYFGAQTGMAVAQALAVPGDVGTISDVAEWRQQTLLHLLGCADLVMISVWSPTFLTELLRHAVAQRNELADTLAMAEGAASDSGGGTAGSLPKGLTETQLDPVPNESPLRSAHARRADTVRAALASNPPDWCRIWPQLQLISCWDQAGSHAPAQQLRAAFPGVTVQGKGLLATEGMVTLPLCDYPWPVLALESGFFEFLDRQGRTWLADEVQEGFEYEFLMTTHSGLYRYPLGDKVRVRGFAGRTPMLEFLGRGNCVSDLCGEKLLDAFVAPHLAALGQQFAMLAPDIDAGNTLPPRYLLLLDGAICTAPQAAQLASQLDAALCANPQYAYAHQLGQLAPLTAVRCDTPLEHWLATRMASGQRLGDIKVPALLTSCPWQSWVRLAADADKLTGDKDHGLPDCELQAPSLDKSQTTFQATTQAPIQSTPEPVPPPCTSNRPLTP